MPTEVVMPKLGLNMSEGLLVEWLKKEGDQVKRGEALFIVETDKVTTESPAQVDGVLSKILVEAGQIVPVRAVVAVLTAAGEENGSGDVTPSASQSSQPAQATSQTTLTPAAVPTPARPGRVLASPLAKKLAQEHHLDLANIPGSGPEGRISQEDVERYIQAQQIGNNKTGTATQAEQPQSAAIPMEGVRAVIAERMFTSLQSMAQLTLHSEIDATGLVAYRERMKKDAGQNSAAVPSYNSILVSTVAKVLKDHPRLNARLAEGHIQLLNEIHVGLAVDTEAGLMVVVVRDADRKSVSQIHAEFVALTERALAHKSMPDDLTGSTFTITNLGMFGIDAFTPIINPPEAAILGVGRIQEKLVIQDGKVAQVPALVLSLTFDHRLVDGAPAARFLQSVGTQIGQLA
jgi:pyruvate dehydrogenase complex dihydrolipoamide acetyltransferase long form